MSYKITTDFCKICSKGHNTIHCQNGCVVCMKLGHTIDYCPSYCSYCDTNNHSREKCKKLIKHKTFQETHFIKINIVETKYGTSHKNIKFIDIPDKLDWEYLLPDGTFIGDSYPYYPQYIKTFENEFCTVTKAKIVKNLIVELQ